MCKQWPSAGSRHRGVVHHASRLVPSTDELIAGIKVPLMTKPLPIMQIAGQLKLAPQDVEPFGWFKGKLAIGLERRLPPPDGVKYVGVTAMSPTPLGEGKTVTAIGLAMALCREGHSAIVTLRQPFQGPVFGIKGGGAGGGLASVAGR